MSEALILTVKLDSETFKQLNELRQRHFPVERNYLDAHITLFHKLPGTEIDAIGQTLEEICTGQPVVPLRFPGVRSLGRGVAIEIDAPALKTIRRRLAEHWQDWLSPQDRQGFRPHVTVQNKVTADQARTLYQSMSATWQPSEGRGEGLLLWRYLGGPWQRVAEFLFVE